MFSTIQSLTVNLAILILLIPLMPLVFIGFLILLPVYLVPVFVSKCGPLIVNNSFSSLVSGHSKVPTSDTSTMLNNGSCDGGTGKQGYGSHGSFSFSFLLGDVDLFQLRDKMSQVLESTGKRDGQLKYPEMKKCVRNWMGYNYLDQCIDFDIKSHVNYYNDEDLETNHEVKMDETKLSQIIWKLRTESFSEENASSAAEGNKPSWEIIIIRNFIPDISTLPRNVKKSVERKYSVVLFHCSHKMIYGQHWNNIFRDICDECDSSSELNGSINNGKIKPSPDDFDESSQTTLVNGLWAHMRFPFDFMKRKLSSPSSNINNNSKTRILNSLINAGPEESSHEFHITFGNVYESEYFTGISKSLKVSPESVILAGIIGGLRSFIECSYIHTHRDLHDFFKLRVPVQVGGSSILCPIDLPLAEPDSLVRLQIIERNMNSLCQDGRDGLICPYILSKCKPPNRSHEKVSGVFSSTNTSEVQLKLQGNVVFDRMDENFLDDDASIVFNMTKYAGRTRLNLNVDKTLIPYEDDSRILFDYIDKEFKLIELSAF